MNIVFDIVNGPVCPDEFDWTAGDNFVVSGTLLTEDLCGDRVSNLSSCSLSKPKRIQPPDPVRDNKLWYVARLS